MPFSQRFFNLLAVAVLAACPAAIATYAPAPPNVVIITIDTLRADHLGCYGYKDIKTPNIDSLAADSTRFEHAFTPVPVTLPSHSSIFTGTYPMLSGMHDFSANKLSPTQPTLASTLKDNGYTTGAVVASAVLDSRFGLNHGFDFYYDHFDFSRLEESNLDEMERPGNLVADQVLDWLGTNYQKKFFLWMHLYDPHHPYRPPPPFDKEYASHPYDGEIAFADAQVGRLIQFLKDKKLYENTIIVLSGDHGESLGEHGEATHGFFIYNATLHVPLIIHVPNAKNEKLVNDYASLIDIMPTLLHALSINVPAQVQGQNLLPLMSGTPEDAQRNLYAESFLPRIHFNWSELRGVENARYHFIDAPKPELYDLSKDPGELHNLLTEKKAVGEEMRAKLATLIRLYSAGQEMAQKTALDPALMERLKSLGYAGFSGGGDPTISNRDLPDPKDRIETYELISDAIALSQHGKFQESVDKLNEALKTEGNSVPVHYLQGLNYYRMKNYPAAVQQLERAVALSPDYTLALFYLGVAYAHTGQTDQSIATLKHELELDPANFTAAYDLGVTYLQKKMVNEAIGALRQALSNNDEYPQAHRTLGEVLLSTGQVDEAIVHLRRAEQLAPADPATHRALAQALSAKGLNDEAQAELQKAQESRPQ
jgi:arylsulfatase A-like enzyme/Tfp pilus assembly protein PilF